MHRLKSAGIVAIVATSLAACSEAPVSPDANPRPPQDISMGQAVGQSGREDVVAGEIIVKLKGEASAEAVSRKNGLEIAEHGYKDAFVVMRGNAGAEYSNANKLAADADVEWAEPNYLRQTTVIDSRLWAFLNPGGLRMSYTSGGTGFIPPGYTSIADADEDNVETYGAGGSPVVIGSIDTGVDLGHSEFLFGQLIPGRNWISKKPNASPTDNDGHGTHTTGTMAGRTVGVAGVSGAGPNVRVYVQKVCGPGGCPTTAIVNAIRAAADYAGMVAMNLSLGGGSLSNAERDAILYATDTMDVLVIASAGNGGNGTVACPACDVNAISVAATNWRDAKTSYSQFGPGLDIAAPGGECYSNTTPEGCIYSSYKGGGYEWLQGTSMAAPQVTGTAGVVASKTGLRGAALRARLLGTVDDKGAAGYDETFGAGRLNSYRAVTNSSLPGEGATPVLTSIVVTPDPVTVTVSTTQQFTAVGYDQFGNVISFTPTWTTNVGTITSGGLLTAQSSAATGTVTATSGSVSDAAAVTVQTVQAVPVTITLYSEAADGGVFGSNADWLTSRAGSGLVASSSTGTAEGVSSSLYAGVYDCQQAFIVFDTSVIPDGATVTSATLFIDRAGYSSGAGVGRARVHDWGTAVTTADWVQGADLTTKPLFASVNVSAIALGSYTAMTSNAGAPALVNKTGKTRLLVHGGDQESTTGPAVGATFNIVTSEGTNKAKLVVTYTPA